VRSPTATLCNLRAAAAIALLAIGLVSPFHAEAIAPTVTITVPGSGHAPPPTKSPPGEVKLGIFLYAVQDLDFSKHTFRATFEVWWRWRGDDFDPLAALSIVGARTITTAVEDRRRLANGENYMVARVDAAISERLDTGAFPFDRHRLTIEIESPYEDDYLRFVVDSEASLLDPDAFSPGWQLTDFRMSEIRKAYPTTFGLKERENERYSRVVVEVIAERVGWRAAVDYFIGFIVCALLCMLGYFIPVNLLAARTTLLTAATIAAVGNKYVVNSLTETSAAAQLVNVAVISAFAMVLTYMLASVRCERISQAGDRNRAERLNRNVGIGSSVVYVIVMSVVFLLALTASPS
jgi:hypothetical protein